MDLARSIQIVRAPQAPDGKSWWAWALLAGGRPTAVLDPPMVTRLPRWSLLPQTGQAAA